MSPRMMKVIFKLQGVKKTGAGYQAKCPGHDDKNPSLSVKEGEDGKVLIYCHAGCSLEQILQGLSLEVRDLFPDSLRIKVP